MHNHRKFTAPWMLLSVFVLLCGLAGCATSDETQPEVSVAPDDLPRQQIAATGEVVPERWASLACIGGAAQLTVHVQTGEKVTAGQKLATCGDQRLASAVYQAKAVLARAQRAYEQISGAPSVAAQASAEAALANARAQYDRLERAEAEAIALAAAQADIDAASASLDALRAGASEKERVAAALDVQAAQAALEQAEAALAVTAPFDGQVAELYARTGESIAALQPLLLVADLSRLQVMTTDLSEVDVARLQPGQKARVVFDALGGEPLSGTIVHIAPRSSGASSVYYETTITFEALPAELRWGMTAFVIFEE